MAEPSSSDNGAAIVPELTALIEDDSATRELCHSTSTLRIQPPPPSSVGKPSGLRENEENQSQRQLFGSMREALESSGQVKEEPGGYVIKRHSGRQQQLRRADSATGRSKYRHAKQRSTSNKSNNAASGVVEEADAAGYTVIRRRSSCDYSDLHASASTHAQIRRNSQASASSYVNKKQQQRSRRGSMSALHESSGLLASISPSPSSSVPPGFQPIRAPPGITSAASGWVAKAAAPVEGAIKIEEPPVEALWPEMKAAGSTSSGWSVTAASSGDSGIESQAWPAGAGENENDGSVGDVDLLTRLGVTL